MKRIALILLFSFTLCPVFATTGEKEPKTEQIDVIHDYLDDLHNSVDELLTAAKQAMAQLEIANQEVFSSVEQGLKAAEEASKPLIESAEESAKVLLNNTKDKMQQLLDEYELQFFSEEFTDYIPHRELELQENTDLDLKREAR